MKKINKVAICLIIVLQLFSCHSNLDSTLDGKWGIDKIIFQEQDLQFCLGINIFHFRTNHIVMPESYCPELMNDIDNTAAKCKIDIIDDDQKIKLIVNNCSYKIFDDTLQIRFLKNERDKLLMMEMYSKDTYILTRKGLFDFDRNIKRIDRLVEMTGGGIIVLPN